MSAATLENVSFDYSVVGIKDLQVDASQSSNGKKMRNPDIIMNDLPYKTNTRFWTSLYSRYGFNDQFMKYFSYDEVFDRIHKVDSNDRIRVCVEKSADKAPSLLAVSNPTKPVPRYEEVLDILKRYEGEKFTYHNGVLSSVHAPSIGGSTSIAGDVFENRFAVNIPIDGYGQTSLYLAMLRQVCSNGAVAMSKAFRSSLNLGKGEDSINHTLIRALDSYNNDEGFHALRQRLEAASKSWASIYEAGILFKHLLSMHINEELDEEIRDAAVIDTRMLSDGLTNPVLKRFHQLTGDTSMLYGMANIDSMSPTRQRKLPVKATVYDLINFATEVATHHSDAAGQRKLQGWFGTSVTNEYDLENSVEAFPDFQDLFLGKKFSEGFTGSQVLDVTRN